MLDMIKLYPDRFVGTAIVDPLGPDPARDDAIAIARAVPAPFVFNRTTAKNRLPDGWNQTATPRFLVRPPRPARPSRA